tara:strand:- start:886 stop:1593 length:708 start_codon:yes stop_codon:yes gene_type:complete
MEEGDLLLCTVEKVTNTITFVRLPNGNQATLISSEIAPGRIKHLRQYVVPNKRIVCKILGISDKNISVSLRRVNSKEKKEIMQNFKQEQAMEVALKQILGENFKKTKEKILEDFENILKFIDAARKDKDLISKYFLKKDQKSIEKIIQKKKKGYELKLLIKMKCLEEDGIKRIKRIFDLENNNILITYLRAGEFKLTLKIEEFKKGKKEMIKIIEELEKRAKKNNCELLIKEEKN